MSTEKTYRWGFVAAGRMAWAQARDLAYSPRNRVGGVMSRTNQSSSAFAREFGAEVYPSLDALLADPKIDLVYISSFNNLHYPHAKAALQAGKPVLCEKPFTLNARELAELIEIAAHKEVLLMEPCGCASCPRP
jgi:predicted dehydrogenase